MGFGIVFSRRRIIVAVLAVILVPVGWLGWWLGSPLFIDKEVNEEFPFSASAQVPEDMSQSEAEEQMATAAGTSQSADEVMGEEMAAAVALEQGEFVDIDRLHQGSGQATIYELADGSRVLRLENLDVTNGPDLRVLLAAHDDPRSRDELESGAGYIELDGLKGNLGNQNYVIPADVDIATFNSVVIYCKPFHVIFSVASLDAVA
jgi:hypothetical protein